MANHVLQSAAISGSSSFEPLYIMQNLKVDPSSSALRGSDGLKDISFRIRVRNSASSILLASTQYCDELTGKDIHAWSCMGEGPSTAAARDKVHTPDLTVTLEEGTEVHDILHCLGYGSQVSGGEPDRMAVATGSSLRFDWDTRSKACSVVMRSLATLPLVDETPFLSLDFLPVGASERTWLGIQLDEPVKVTAKARRAAAKFSPLEESLRFPEWLEARRILKRGSRV